MSTWLFDLGNSRLKCAPLHDDGSIGAVIAIDHADGALAAALQTVLPARIEAASIASVAPAPLRVQLLDALAQRCGRMSLARTASVFAGVRIAYAQPQNLGVDRFLGLLAAHARGEGAWLLVGVGTALTIDLLDGEGRHHGGRIAPSPALMRATLHDRARQLPAHGGRYVEFADDTADALQSGCVGTALALIERSQSAAHTLLGTPARLLLHGGGAESLLPQLSATTRPDAMLAPALVLEGLAQWTRATAR